MVTIREKLKNPRCNSYWVNFIDSDIYILMIIDKDLNCLTFINASSIAFTINYNYTVEGNTIDNTDSEFIRINKDTFKKHVKTLEEKHNIKIHLKLEQ